MSLYPLWTNAVHVDAEAQGAVVDAHEMVVREDAFPDGVNHHLVVDGKKLPLSDSLYGLYLFGRDVDIVVRHNLHRGCLDSIS